MSHFVLSEYAKHLQIDCITEQVVSSWMLTAEA
jgi:hypothetical protein